MSLKPNTDYTSTEIVNRIWTFGTGITGSVSVEQLQAAASVEIAHQLRLINQKLDSLGNDGIHLLIRLATAEARARDNARREKIRRKRRRTLAAKKKAQVARE